MRVFPVQYHSGSFSRVIEKVQFGIFWHFRPIDSTHVLSPTQDLTDKPLYLRDASRDWDRCARHLPLHPPTSFGDKILEFIRKLSPRVVHAPTFLG